MIQATANDMLGKLTPSSSLVSASLEYVDTSIITVIERLFPSPMSRPGMKKGRDVSGGIEFLARCLGFATVRQQAMEIASFSDVAVIECQSVRELARHIRCAYETTYKYVTVFCALKLFIKRDVGGKTCLYFPLCHYELPPPDALDPLITQAHAQVAQCAHRVKVRLAQLTCTSSYETDQRRSMPVPPVSVPLVLSPPAPVPVLVSLLDTVKQALQDILHQANDFETLTTSVATFLECCKNQQDLSAPESTSCAEQVDFCERKIYQHEEHINEKSTCLPVVLPKESRLVEQQVDSEVKQVGCESKQVDSEVKQVDSRAEQVDSCADEALNGNVITVIKETITFNVSLLAALCCRSFEEPVSKRGIYKKIFRDIGYDAPVVTAVYIYVLVHWQDGTVRNRAALFLRRCKDWHQTTIPSAALALVEHYGHYSPTQLLKVLQHGEPPVAPAPSIAKSPHTDVGAGAVEKVGSTDPIKPAPLQQCQCTDQKMPLVPRIALKAAGGMTLEDAQRLIRHLKDDRRVGLCRMGLAALANGSYAVMIDDTRPFSVNPNQVISSFIDIYHNSWYNLIEDVF